MKVDTKVGVPHKELQLLPARNPGALQTALAQFEKGCLHESPSAQVSWDDKVGFSLFDEEIVLGTCGEVEAADELQFLRDQLTGYYADNAEGAGEPRELTLIKRVCGVHRLEKDTQHECPICLEKLLAGQDVWTLPCMHQVHGTCGSRFFTTRHRKRLCPMCRWDVRRGTCSC